MAMKVDIEIVTGFIGSGKTSFINALLESTLEEGEKVVIVQLEAGETEIEEKFKKDKRIRFTILPFEEFSEKKFSHILQRVAPHRVIIEFNGTEDISSLLDLIYSKDIRKLCKLTTTYFLSDAATFEPYLNNMGRFLLPCLQISNLILLNNTKQVSNEELDSIKKTVKAHKDFLPILEIQDGKEIKEVVSTSNLFHKGILKRWDLFLKDLLK